jgi:hypothetical protein
LKAPLIRQPAGEAQRTLEKVTGNGRAHGVDRGGCPAEREEKKWAEEHPLLTWDETVRRDDPPQEKTRGA